MKVKPICQNCYNFGSRDEYVSVDLKIRKCNIISLLRTTNDTCEFFIDKE